jgi:23S rRNA (pseudouridine1915-N3)-methyltransferase
MRVLLVAVGRLKSGPERDLYEHYAARLSWPIRLKEIDARPPLPPAQQKAREGDLLLAAVPEDAKLIALDETGELLTSAGFAARLGAWRDQGAGELAFVIGGADGLDARLHERADLRLSLGLVTWPHLLVRGLLAEQLYRAQQILAGHPYHRA